MIIYFIIIVILFIIIFFIVNKYINYSIKEHFCKLPEINYQGGINDKNVALDYLPQSNIITSSCDEYWKDWPLEVNNDLVQDDPIVIKSDQLDLPKERMFGDNMYKAGLIDFKELAKIMSDQLDYDIFDKSSDLLIDPLTKKDLPFQYQVNYEIIVLNRKTWINRWYKYNPSIKQIFKYDEIQSPIEDINILNLEFKERIDRRQERLLSKQNLLLYGMVPYEIFKYKIINIKYLDNDKNKPVYVIQIALFREKDLYLNTFAYVGFIQNGKPILTEIKYIGRNSTDTVLLAQFNDPTEIKQEIINKNFSNMPILEKDPDAIVKLTKEHQESFKIKNQWGCFNINYDPNTKEQVLLPYFSREQCESSVDPYGRPKSIGIYDKPCKNNNECPFYKSNKNYENEFGKCLESGYCELPSNMERIGYRYYKDNKQTKPLCYNCKSTNGFRVFTDLDNCCDEQYDKNKYPFLESPDFSFNNDFESRKNFFNQKNCYSKPDSPEIICK